MHSVDRFFEHLESNNESTHFIPLSLSMLENILTISNEPRISLSGKFLLTISSIKSNKCDVSFRDFLDLHKGTLGYLS